VLLLGEIAGLAGGASLKSVGPDGGVVLGVQASEKLVQAAIGANNLLALERGTWSFPLSMAVNNAFGWGESIHAEATTGRDIGNFFNGTGKLQAYGAGINLPILADGLALSAGVTGVRTNPTVPPFTFIFPNEKEATKYQKTYARLTYPLLLSLRNTVRVQLGYDHVDYQVNVYPFPSYLDLANGPFFSLSRDRYDDLRVAGEWITRFPWELGGQSTLAMFFIKGLGGRGASQGEAIPLSRPFSSPTFSKLRVDWRVVQPLPEQFLVSAFVKAQTSFGASLMLPENLSLDGPDGVSGFAAGSLNVDRGVAGRIELGRTFKADFDTTSFVATPYLFAAAGRGVHEAPFFSLPPFPSEKRFMRAEAYGGGVRADVNLFGSQTTQESVAIEFARTHSNIPLRENGYRTNFSYTMRYGGTPFALPAPTRRGSDGAPLWTGLYAGLNAGYSAGGSANAMGAAPIFTFLDAAGSFSQASSLAGTTRNKAASGGFVGGAQFGANAQFDRVLVGLETDLQGAGIRSRSNPRGSGVATDGFGLAFVNSAADTESTVNWLGTVRARAGFLVTPRLLAYGTGGFAYGGVSTHSLLSQLWTGAVAGPVIRPTGARNDGATVRGGYTAGAGLEWMFGPHITVKGEYLYYNLGAVQSSAGLLATAFPGPVGAVVFNVAGVRSQSRLDGHIFRLGLNYHFNALDPEAPLASRFTKGPLAARTERARRWGGFYAGLNAGYGWGLSNGLTTVAAPAANALDVALGAPFGAASAAAATGLVKPSVHGALAGGQIGYTLPLSAFALGAEADISGAGIRGRAAGLGLGATALGGLNTVLSANEAVKTVDWLATARARVGFFATQKLLAYGTAGLAAGGVTAQTAINQQWGGAAGDFLATTGATGRYSGVKVGWTAGAGVEWMFAPELSLKAEYLYYDLGSAQFANSALGTSFVAVNTTSSQTRARFNGQLARVGLNYHFNMPGVTDPIVTRY
jgi:outer membrane immunogenic protein